MKVGISVDGDIRSDSCGAVLMDPFGCHAAPDELDLAPLDAGRTDMMVMVMFRVAIGAEPLRWGGHAGDTLAVQLQTDGAEVAVCSTGAAPRSFYTAQMDLVYPEYLIYYQKAKSMFPVSPQDLTHLEL
jgi:hypothetical protein